MSRLQKLRIHVLVFIPNSYFTLDLCAKSRVCKMIYYGISLSRRSHENYCCNAKQIESYHDYKITLYQVRTACRVGQALKCLSHKNHITALNICFQFIVILFRLLTYTHFWMHKSVVATFLKNFSNLRVSFGYFYLMSRAF